MSDKEITTTVEKPAEAPIEKSVTVEKPATETTTTVEKPA